MYYINVVEDFNLFDFIDENEFNKVSFIEDDLFKTAVRIKNIIDNTKLSDNEHIQVFLNSKNHMSALGTDMRDISYKIREAFSKNDEIKVEVLSEWDVYEKDFITEDFVNASSSYLYSIYVKNEKSYTESIL